MPGAAGPSLTADVAGIPVEDADGPLVEADVEPPPLEQALRAAQSPRMARVLRMLATINLPPAARKWLIAAYMQKNTPRWSMLCQRSHPQWKSREGASQRGRCPALLIAPSIEQSVDGKFHHCLGLTFLAHFRVNEAAEKARRVFD